jgi:hypothetical protein
LEGGTVTRPRRSAYTQVFVFLVLYRTRGCCGPRFRNLADKRKHFYNLAAHAFAAFFAMAFCLLVGRVLARAFLLFYDEDFGGH